MGENKTPPPPSACRARVWSLGQSLGPEESGVWVRVWGQSLESGSERGARVWGQSLESGSEFGARDWVRAWCQSSGPESGVWVRVWGRSLGPELGQSLGPKSRHPKPNPEMRLGESLESGCGSGFGSGLVRVWGQNLDSGSGFGARVWSLGSESESRHPKPNREISVWSRVLGLGLDQGLTKIGSEFGAESGVWGPSPSLGTQSQTLKRVWVKVWSRVLGPRLIWVRAQGRVRVWSLGQSLGAGFDSECGVKLN